MSRLSATAIASLLILSLQGCVSTSIPRAAFEGDAARITKYLSEEKKTVQDRFDDGGCTGCGLLHYAAVGGKVNVARLLVEKGADVNLVSGQGQTPLHAACANQELEMVRFLLANGAKPSLSVADQASNTPLILAVAYTKEREATAFIPSGPVVATQRAPGPSVEIIEALIAAGADVNVPTRLGNTPLHIAAYKGYGAAVGALLSKGADREAKNQKGETPEMLAELFKQPQTAKLIREYPAK